MSFTQAVSRWVQGVVPVILMVWSITLLTLYSFEVNDARQERAKLTKLESQSFEDYMVYYAINPVMSLVPYGSDARYISDSEVLKGPFWIEWREKIECDYSPHDGVEFYEYYAAAETTETTFKKPVARPDRSLTRAGFPVRSLSSSRIIQYPVIDADCRLVSRMTQHHPYGHLKTMVKNSEVVQVRSPAHIASLATVQ